MKKLFIAAIMSLSLLMTSAFAEIKVGIILGFTGPIESLTPAMRDSAKLAFQEASDSGALLGGETITVLPLGLIHQKNPWQIHLPWDNAQIS